jgi:hypothetical protein
MPIKDAIDNLGTIRPVKTMGRPGIVMSHRCVDLTWLPSGKMIINCFIAGQMFLMGVPSIMNMGIAPVSAIACDVAIVIASRYWGEGAPYRCHAVATNDGQEAGCACITCCRHTVGEQFDMVIITSSSLHMCTIWVGSKG